MQAYAKLADPINLYLEDPVGQKVELYIQCRNLKDLDTFSKSDPQVRLLIKDGPTASTWKNIGETEVIDNNLNPDFRRTLQAFYQFEINQTVRFDVVDSDGPNQTEMIGQVETSLASLVGAKDCIWTADLHVGGKKEKRG